MDNKIVIKINKMSEINKRISELHDAILKNVQGKKKTKEAEILQSFFYYLKNGSNNKRNPFTKIEREGIMERAGFKTDLQNVFKRFGKENSLKMEEWVSRMLVATFATDKKKDWVRKFVKKNQVASGKNQVDLNKKAFFNNIQFELEENSKTIDIDFHTVKATGKTDINGTKLDINYTLSPRLKLTKVYNIVKNSRFSLKNYVDSKYVQNTIKKKKQTYSYSLSLGNTLQDKAILGALQHQNLGNQDPNTAAIYYGYLQISDDGESHLSELQFAYELAGSTITDDAVDFLIYNVPGTKEIYVKSVYEIIEQRFTNEDFSKLTKTIPKSYFTSKQKT